MPETELKLAAALADLPKIRDALLAMPRSRRTASGALISTYYDTSDFALGRRRLVLRVRRQAGRFIQTVKAETRESGDLLTREEWEDRIAGAMPDLTAPHTRRSLDAAGIDGDLRMLFTTTVRRTTILIEPLPGVRVEAALDMGEIRTEAGGRTAPISEVELELKRGEPTALYDLALRLVRVAPLRLSLAGKAERGYALLASSAPPMPGPPALILDGGMTVEAAFRAVGRRCLAQLLRHEPAALAGQPEGIHQMRVALRRLRAALAVLRPMLPAEQRRWASTEIKWLAGALGPAREGDVFAADLAAPGGDAASGSLSGAVEARLRAAHAAAEGAIRSPRYTVGLLRLARWIEGRGWRDPTLAEPAAGLLSPLAEVAPELIARSFRAAVKRSRHFAGLAARDRHRLRIALKTLRYTVEIMAPIFPRAEVRRFLKRLRCLQEELGRMNDRRVADRLLAELRETDHTAAAADDCCLVGSAADEATVEPRLRRQVKRLRRTQPFWRGPLARPARHGRRPAAEPRS